MTTSAEFRPEFAALRDLLLAIADGAVVPGAVADRGPGYSYQKYRLDREVEAVAQRTRAIQVGVPARWALEHPGAVEISAIVLRREIAAPLTYPHEAEPEAGR